MALLTNINGKFSVSDVGAVTFNNAFTFPTADGAANYVLQTNGSGQLAWALNGNGDISGSGTANTVTKFTGAKTIGNGPITFSSNESTFTGRISVTGDISADNYINIEGATNPYLRIQDITNEEYLNLYSSDNESAIVYTQDTFKISSGVDFLNQTPRLTINSSGNATFTGTVTAPTFSGDLNGTINTVTTATTKGNSTNDTTVATTAFVQNVIGTIPAGLVFQGTWNASTNSPTLTSGSGTTGNFYIVSVAGSTNLDGITDWQVGDWAVFIEQGASDQWEKIDNSSVLSGSGTGGSFAGWSGSGTSVTLGNAPVTFSGNNSTFAGNITSTATSFVQTFNVTDNSTFFNINHVGNEAWLFKCESIGGGTADFITIGASGGGKVAFGEDGSAIFEGDVTINKGAAGDPTLNFIESSGGTQNAKIRFDQASENQLYITTSYASPTDANRILLQPGGYPALIAYGGANGIGSTKVQVTNDLEVDGNVSVKIGNDLRLYRSDNATYARFNYAGSSVGLDIDDLNGDGINLQQAGVNKLRIETNGNATFAGDVSLADSKQLKLGNGADLLIFHDGANSYIKDTGTGNLEIRSNFLKVKSPTAEDMIWAQENAGVTLFHNNVSKLTTTSTGVSVTGELEATSLDINGNGDISGTLTVHNTLTVNKSQGTSALTINHAGNGGWTTYASTNDGVYGYIGSGSHLLSPVINDNDFVLRAQGEFAVSIASSEKFRINSSGNVGIGTTSNINAPLTVQADGSAGTINLIGRSNGVYDESIISFYENDGTTRKGYILNSAGNMYFATGGSNEHMVIESTGVVKFPNTATSTGDVGTIAHYTNNYMYIRGGTSGLAIGDDGFGVSVYLNNSDSMQFNTGGTQRMRITSTGVVEIGSSTAQTNAKLNVRNNGSVIEFGHTNNGGRYFGTVGSYGSNGQPFISFGTYCEQSANTFTTIDGKGNIITNDAFGNLIFQQVTSAAATGQTPVERMRITDLGRVVIGSGTASANTLTLVGSAVELDIHNTSGKRWRFNADTSGNLKFEDKTGGTEAMRIASNGNVGIGTNSPDTKLMVSGEILSENSNGGYFVSTRVPSSSSRPTLNFYGSALDINYVTGYAGGGASTAMTILSGGNVGIGTATPSAKLTVTEDAAASKTILLTNNYATGVEKRYSSLISQYSTADSSFESGFRFLIERATAGNFGSAIGFMTELDSSSKSFDYRMYIKNDKVGIGNTSPQTTLHVGTTTSVTNQFTNQIAASNFFVNGNANGGASFFQCKTAAVNINMMGNNDFACNQFTFYHKPLSTSQNVVGTIATFSSSTQYNTTSDYRLKENVIPLSDSIIRLKQLKPSRFNFIEDPERTMDGFLAHEVQNTVPEAVNGEKDAVDENGNEVHQGIDQAKIVPLLVAAVQEQQEIIESLKQRIEQLEN